MWTSSLDMSCVSLQLFPILCFRISLYFIVSQDKVQLLKSRATSTCIPSHFLKDHNYNFHSKSLSKLKENTFYLRLSISAMENIFCSLFNMSDMGWKRKDKYIHPLLCPFTWWTYCAGIKIVCFYSCLELSVSSFFPQIKIKIERTGRNTD